MLDIHSLAEKHHDDAVSNIKDVTFENSEGPRTWITMGLCWSANAQVHGKENFPYKGQLISKCPFGVFKSQKKNETIFLRISALASTEWSNQRNMATLYH